MGILSLVRDIFVGHRELGRTAINGYSVKPVKEVLRKDKPFILGEVLDPAPPSDVCGFGYWVRLGRDPDGRVRFRYHWIQFNPATGRWR